MEQHRRRVSFISTLLEIVILRNPGILLFALLNLTELASFAPAHLTASLVIVLVAALLVLTRVLAVGTVADWFNVASLFAAIMFVVICIGVVVRRVAAQWAQTTVAAQAEAVEHARLHQRIADLHDQA